jgi:hypothetical protein
VIYADVYVKGGDKYGVIEYDNKEDMKYALRKLDREKIHGQRVRIVEQVILRAIVSFYSLIVTGFRSAQVVVTLVHAVIIARGAGTGGSAAGSFIFNVIGGQL